ncbi:MAG TPA: NHLP bacteriocin system secretion protein [Thermoanaerobaculia bacterium]|jgi:HlyD family secretion protein|nr:NHLP bacteriocin system secretion protein [Thermoanaerobaculia bacterium]
MSKKLFRQAALDRLASPERLDELMRVTSPVGWIALAAIGVGILVATIWGFVGRITTKVDGQGILLRGDAVLDVTSSSEGRLISIDVGVGDIVKAGQQVASVEQPDLELQLRNKQRELATLRAQDSDQMSAVDRINARHRKQLEELHKEAVVLEGLIKDGLATLAQKRQTEAQIAALEQEIANSRVMGAGRTNLVAGVEDEISQLENALEDRRKVLSPYTGRVLELMIDPGNLVVPGSRILTLETLGAPVDAVVYIPAQEGKKVVPGMRARISPSTVRVEEYGYIIGEVKSVADFPSTPEGLERTLRNSNLVAALSGRGAPLEVVVRLGLDTKTPSGFDWSSSQGPPVQVFTGTLCAASVEVAAKKPAEYVLPFLKQLLGTTA